MGCRHEVGKTAAHRFTHFLLFMLGIQTDDRLARLKQIQNQQLHQVGLALARVSQNEDAGRGLILISLVKVHQDVDGLS